MQPPSISLNFNLAKLLLFLISARYVPPFAEIQGFFKIKIRRPSLRLFFSISHIPRYGNLFRRF